MQTYDFCGVPSKCVETLPRFSTPQFAGLVKGACGNPVSERERRESEWERGQRARERKRKRAPVM